MPVIAMTREMGSRSGEVARRLAEEMGLRVALQGPVAHDAAPRAHALAGSLSDFFGSGVWRSRHDGTESTTRATAEEVFQLARRGNVVIRGWSVCVLLRDVPHVARVRVCAPREERKRTVMQRRALPDWEAARREIERDDDAHTRTLQARLGADRNDPLLYDLVLNTERMSIATCVHLIRELAARLEFSETEASRAILDDKLLEVRIRCRLLERFTAGTGVSDLQVVACGGKVVLRGIAVHSTLAREAGGIAGTTDGVKDVINRIEVVRAPRGL